MPKPPLTFGRFRLEQELALGAYGATFSGRDLEAARAVHVTLFHPAFFAEPRKKAQMERVARAIAYDDPHVAPTYAVGEAHGSVWVATAPVVGVPLTHWRRDAGVIRPDDVYRIVGQLLDAVEAIHRGGGVHGSLSPETVRVVHEQAWITSPWWLEASDVPDGEVQPLRTAWMAPELLFGEFADSPATDVYGVGLALGYLLACGLTEPGHSLLVQGIDVPPAVDDVYVRATARQKAGRYQDVASFRAALEQAAGFEWHDAQKALRRGAGTGLVGLEVLEAGPMYPRAPTRPPALPVGRANSGLLPLKPVVLSAVPMSSEEAALPSPQPPAIVSTESVLAGVAGRAAIHSEVERTSEDAAFPAFEVDGAQADGGELLAAAPATPPAPTGPSRRPPEAPQPLGRRASRVSTRTLPHGVLRSASGLAPVLEVDFRRADPPDPTYEQGPLPGPEGDPTDGLAGAIPEEMLRALMEAPDIELPPPLPGQTRPRWSGANANWGSSLEALDVDGPALRLGAPESRARGLEPRTATGGVQPPDPGPPPPPMPGGERSPAGQRATDASGGEDAAHAYGAMGPAEPTVVEAIAPSLLELDVLTPDKRAPPPVDLFAPPRLQPPDPWSDSPLVSSPGESSSANLQPDALPVLDPAKPPSRPAGRPATAPSLSSGAGGSTVAPAPQSVAVATALDKELREGSAAGGPDATIARLPGEYAAVRPATRPRMARADSAPAVPATREEPRVLRDPSGPLAGAAATLSGMPIRSGGPMMRTDGAMVAATVERRSITLWLALGGVLVGGIVAFFALSSGGSGTKAVGGSTGELASVGVGGLGAGSGPLSGESGVTGLPVLADPEAAGAEPERSDKQPDAAGEGPDVSADVAAIGPAGDASIGDLGGLGAPPDVAEVSGEPPPDARDATLTVLAGPVSADAAITTAPETRVEQGATPDEGTPAPLPANAEVVGGDSQKDVEIPDTAGAMPVGVFTPKDPAQLRCPDGMSKLKRKIPVTLADGSKVEDWDVACIDRFEFPGAGAVPKTGVDLSGARAACIGKGKRLCTSSEWRRACGGKYPYGKDYDGERCNTASADGAPRGLVGAGSKRGCMSPSGAFDMVGNAAEWTSDGTVNGGTSLKNGEDATCGSSSRRAGGATYIGFRCCTDAK